MLTRKDFTEIAKIIRETTSKMEGISPTVFKVVLVERFCEYLEKQNPRFDREKFIRACKGDRT